MVAFTEWLGTTPAELRDEIRDSDSVAMRTRRAQVVVNLIGIGAMMLTTLLQTGVVRRLPDPRIGRFDTKKVNTSDEAFSYGGPDSPINIAAHATNVILASTGSVDRARTHPWLPLAATAIAGAQAAVAAKYLFYQMPKVDHAWCPYCIVDALTHFANFSLTLREAADAMDTVTDRLAERR